MKGFILKLQKARDEDMIVTILSSKSVKRYYRFYGARHSILQMGYLIDFEEEQDKANFLPRMRSLSHIGFPWLYDREKLMLWHQFIALFERHFRDIETIESFYFDTLLEAAKRWEKQNPKRLIVEVAINILKYEGRLQPPSHCVICNNQIVEFLAPIQGFLPAHPECAKSPAISKKDLMNLFESGSTILLDDATIEQLYLLALKGF